MIARLDHALRTLVGPWLALPVLTLEIANLLQRGSPWRGEVLWTADWLGIALFVAGPLVAGAAAVDAARLTRPGIIHLAMGPRGHRVFLRALGWCVVPVATIHVAALVAAMVIGGAGLGGLFDLDTWLVVLPQLAAILWYGCLGSLVGRLTTPVAAGLAGSILGLAAFYAMSSGRGDRFELLALGGATVSRLGLQVNPAFITVQVLVLLATSSVMVLTAIRLRQGHRFPTRTATALLVAALVAGAVTPTHAPQNRLAAAPPSQPDMCFETDPTTICFFSEHARVAPGIAAQLNLLTDAADAAGYASLAPSRIDEQDRVHTLSDWSFEVPHTAFADQPYDLATDLLQDLLLPSQCAALTSVDEAPPDLYFDNLFSVIITWLSLLDDPQYSEAIQLETEAGRRILTPDQVDTIIDGFHSCTLDVTV